MKFCELCYCQVWIFLLQASPFCFVPHMYRISEEFCARKVLDVFEVGSPTHEILGGIYDLCHMLVASHFQHL
jgi:hypothetical protein